MATLTIVKSAIASAAKDQTIRDFEEIKKFLSARGIDIQHWQANCQFEKDASQETILKAYEHELKPYMDQKGFKTADVISVHPGTENIEAIRQKFLKEHTHSEDEVRFFVDGEGLFWFHLEEKEEVFSIKCVAGDFLAVPAGFKHWFDLAPAYFVKAIRIFTNVEGWVAHYTGSGVDEKFNS